MLLIQCYKCLSFNSLENIYFTATELSLLYNNLLLELFYTDSFSIIILDSVCFKVDSLSVPAYFDITVFVKLGKALSVIWDRFLTLEVIEIRLLEIIFLFFAYFSDDLFFLCSLVSVLVAYVDILISLSELWFSDFLFRNAMRL